jgi:2',3'-cyclic-nucleotide 2'-phosphodiesterase (5'-nucleotidase family)
MKTIRWFLLLSVALLSACSVSVRTSSEKADEPKPAAAKATQIRSDIVEVTLMQLNDVYEITPVEGGKFGGMARVAAVRQQLVAENPNTFTFLAGDFISPSAIGTSSYQGKRINGAQMVAAMNAAGVDFVCFGNHEFDLGYEPLQERINESKFTWISSNIQYTPSTEGEVKPFEKITSGKAEPFPEFQIINVKNKEGVDLRIGIIGVTLGNSQPPYIVWSDPVESAKRVYEKIKSQTDIVIALTHLSIEEDKNLAKQLPQLALILGGHEHTNMMFKEGNTIISKADANARTVYVHRLRWNGTTKSLNIVSEIKSIDASVAEEPATAKVVNEWTTRAYAGFREKSFDPDEIVTTFNEYQDGRESSIRFKQTNLGSLIAKSMLATAKSAKIAVFNSGSIRLDDQLFGVTTQYDIIRTLPFGGKLFEVQMKGSLLQKLLDAGEKNAGRGGYLQYEGVAFDPAKKVWNVAGKMINAKATYWVIVSDFLFSGREAGIEFFSKENPDVLNVVEPRGVETNDLRRDIRLAVIGFLKKE